MVRAAKVQFNTYGKKKGKPKVNNLKHCNFFNTTEVTNVTINITNNYFIQNKSSSLDEFDKLLKGPTYQEQKQTSIASLSRGEWQCFSKRQQTMSMYHSDVGSSDSSSVHLFKDVLKDSDAFSPSRLPSPPSHYVIKKIKAIKGSKPGRKNADRVFKRKTKKAVVKAVKHRTNDSNSDARYPVNAACSTPTNSALLPPENAISPILPPGLSFKLASSDISSFDMFAAEEKEESLKTELKQQSLGISALLKGMGNLGITTPHPKSKRVENSQHCSEDSTKEESPSEVKENVLKTSVELNNESEDCKTEVINAEPSPENNLKSFTLNKVTYYRPKSKINVFKISTLNCDAEKTHSLDGSSNEICESSRKPNIKECLNNSNSLSNSKEIEILEKCSSDDSIGEESCTENKEKVATNCNMNNQSKNESSRSIEVLEDQTNQNNSTNETPEKNTSSDGNTSSITENSPPARLALRTKPGIDRSLISKCVETNEKPTEENSRPNRLSLQPGKKWRRSLLQYKHRESKECTSNTVPPKGRRFSVGPALLAKLIAANITLNSTKQSFNATHVDIDKILSNVDNSMSSFNISTNSLLNNSPEMRRVSMRSRRFRTNRERRPVFGENNMDEIIEESLFQLSDKENHDDSKNKSYASPTEYSRIVKSEITRRGNEEEQFYQSEIFEEIVRTSSDRFVNFESERGTLHLQSRNTYHSNSNFNESPDESQTKNLASPTIFTPTSDSNRTPRRNKDQLDKSEIERTPKEFEWEPEHLQSHSPNHSNTNFETPPILKMNANVLNTITKRRTRAYSRQSLLFDISDEKPDNEIKRTNDDSPTNESSLCQDLPPLCNDERALAKLIENMDEDKHRLLKRAEVMIRCGQTNPIPFSEAFPDQDLATSIKIGEGVFGEVFMCQRRTGVSVVKIIPVEGSQAVNGEPQKLFDEVLSELIISEELSLLRDNLQFCTSGFCEVKNKFCVQGKYPSVLLDLWHEFDRKKKSDNDCPDMFGPEQLYIALELDHAGEALEAFCFKYAKETYSVYLQTVFTLGVAEMALEFEHRDLHLGNVLVKSTNETYVSYILNGCDFRLPTYGLKATIIDFTLSRMTVQNEVLFYDLEKDPELFTGSGDYQFEVYRLMRSDVQQDWREHVAKTNLRWLHYLVDKILTKCKYRYKKSKTHSEYLKKLEKHKQLILDFSSSSELAEFLVESYFETIAIIETN